MNRVWMGDAVDIILGVLRPEQDVLNIGLAKSTSAY